MKYLDIQYQASSLEQSDVGLQCSARRYHPTSLSTPLHLPIPLHLDLPHPPEHTFLSALLRYLGVTYSVFLTPSLHSQQLPADTLTVMATRTEERMGTKATIMTIQSVDLLNHCCLTLT
jgi:hypothetical protein